MMNIGIQSLRMNRKPYGSLLLRAQGSLRLSSSVRPRRLPTTTTRTREWKKASASSRQKQRPPLGGIPTYVWVAAAGTTATLGYMYYAYLDQVPLTDRNRWIATSPQLEEQLGNEEYQQLLQQFQNEILPPSHPASITVKRVGSRLAEAARDFCREHHLKVSHQPFTYTVVRNDTANAFVLPGNHIFVMTGLFKYVHSEDELAAVLGHEMSHNIARHAGEKISGSLVVGFLARLSLLWDPSGAIFAILLPAASVFRELPNSRTQETEADAIGLYLAAQACYDPRAAPQVFVNMKAEGGGAPPEFLSTHPSHDSRISKFDEWMPEAVRVLNSNSDCSQVRQDMSRARQQAARRAYWQEQE